VPTSYFAPGVYVEEVSTGPKPIAGVPTNVAAIVGKTEKGPALSPERLTSWNDYITQFGGYLAEGYTPEAVFGFFENGGAAIWVVRADNAAAATWQVTDANGVDSFLIEADSPGEWGERLAVSIARDFEGARGQFFATRLLGNFTPSTAAANPDVKVESTLGAYAGMPVSLADSSGATVDATATVIDATTLRLTTTSTSTNTFGPAGDARVFARHPQAATTMRLSSGSGFKPREAIRIMQPDAATRSGGVTAVAEAGSAADLTLAAALGGNDIPGLVLARRTYEIDARLSSEVAANTSIRFGGTQLDFQGQAGFVEADLSRLVTPQGVDAFYDSTNGFQLPQKVGPGPVKVQVRLSARQLSIETPGGITRDELVERLAFMAAVPGLAGTSVTARKVGGGQVALTWDGTTLTGSATELGPFAGADIGVTLTKPVVVRAAAAPRAGDYIQFGAAAGTGRVRVEEVLQPPGTPAGAYVLRLANNTVTLSGTTWAITAWQSTEVQAVRFRIDAALAGDAETVSETFRSLALDPAHPFYYARESQVNGPSRLITVHERAATAPNALALGSQPAGIAKGAKGAAGVIDSEQLKKGFDALDTKPEPAIVACPDTMLIQDELRQVDVINKMIGHCERFRRFAVVDLPVKEDDDAVLQWRLLHLNSTYAAGYAPWLKIINPRVNPKDSTIYVPPSGHVMGVFARTDTERGVFKAPANESVRSSVGLMVDYSQRRQELLNPNGVNLIRAFPGRGQRIWGARTLTDDPLWMYVSVRRLFLMLESSIERSTQWVVFEPNDDTTWLRVRVSVENFLNGIWRAGGLAGTSPEQAYRVRVGLGETMTETDIDLGLMIIEVSAAPVKPAEFVVFRVSHKRLTE
jgi:uncharacterized protein